MCRHGDSSCAPPSGLGYWELGVRSAFELNFPLGLGYQIVPLVSTARVFGFLWCAGPSEMVLCRGLCPLKYGYCSLYHIFCYPLPFAGCFWPSPFLFLFPREGLRFPCHFFLYFPKFSIEIPCQALFSCNTFFFPILTFVRT